MRVLGAEGVQIGTRFALTVESSASEAFKQRCLNLAEGDTKLLLRKLSPTRLVRGGFFDAIEQAENNGASEQQLLDIIGTGASRRGIFEGDLDTGELEIGQVASLLQGRDQQTVAEVFAELLSEYATAKHVLA